MRSSRPTLARPLRTVLNSVFTASTALSMRCLASASSSFSTVLPFPRSAPGGRAHHGAHAFAREHAHDVVAGHPEDVDGHLVVHAEAERGGVHHLEAALDGLEVRELRDELGARLFLGVGSVHAVVLALEGAQRRRGVGAEVRVAGAAGADHHAPLLQVTDGAPAAPATRTSAP